MIVRASVEEAVHFVAEADEWRLAVQVDKISIASPYLSCTLRILLVQAVAAAHVVHVLIRVQAAVHVVVVFGAAHPDELVVLRRVLLDFFINLNLKLFKLLLHFVVDVPLVDQEIV